uniref:Ig-like domain-containing protein n=1 Tax=Anopheles dirus TaxID=7168 RepID=A0A182N0P1_9DIPT
MTTPVSNGAATYAGRARSCRAADSNHHNQNHHRQMAHRGGGGGERAARWRADPSGGGKVLRRDLFVAVNRFSLSLPSRARHRRVIPACPATLPLLIAASHRLPVSAFEPDFVYPLENVTVAKGRDATFTCVVNNLGGYRVSGEATPARSKSIPKFFTTARVTPASLDVARNRDPEITHDRHRTDRRKLQSMPIGHQHQ